MAKTQFTPPKQRFSHRRILGALVALTVTFLLLTSVVNIAGKYFAIRRHIKELSQEQLELKKKQATLAATNTYIATPEGQEQVLREKYGVVRPGEGMIVVAAEPITTEQTSRPSIVVRWWRGIIRGLGMDE